MASHDALDRRIVKALEGNVSDEFIKDYLKQLRENIKDSSQSIRRYALLAWTLAAIFELVNRNAVAFVLFGLVRIDKVNLVLIAIPPVLTYFCLQYLINYSEMYDCTYVHDQILRKKCAQSFYENDLEMFMHPPSSTYHQAIRTSQFTDNLLSTSYLVAAYLSFHAPMALAILFDIYAFWQLFTHNTGGNWIIGIAVAVSSFLVIQGAAFMKVSS